VARRRPIIGQSPSWPRAAVWRNSAWSLVHRSDSGRASGAAGRGGTGRPRRAPGGPQRPCARVGVLTCTGRDGARRSTWSRCSRCHAGYFLADRGPTPPRGPGRGRRSGPPGARPRPTGGSSRA
jgi:hypothetical protein